MGGIFILAGIFFVNRTESCRTILEKTEVKAEMKTEGNP